MLVIDKLPQIIAGATFLVFVLAFVHEFAYFQVVGSQFQHLMTATDYLVSAISWMPFIGIVLFVVTLAILALARLVEGRPHQEMMATSKPYRRFAFIMETFFGTGAAVGFATAALLFGNPYLLNLLQSLVAVGFITFLFWLKKFELFGRILTIPVILIASGLPLLVMLSFVTGRADGYRALTFPTNIHVVRLKNVADETKMSVLRVLNAGVLAKRLEENKVLFYRWDQIETLTLEFTPLDSRSLVCRVIHWSCPNI